MRGVNLWILVAALSYGFSTTSCSDGSENPAEPEPELVSNNIERGRPEALYECQSRSGLLFQLQAAG